VVMPNARFYIRNHFQIPNLKVLFRGADRGPVEGSSGTIRYERSLRLDEAGDSGAILAYVMNGEPLPIHHGFPLRLIVPS
jgi:DMSO/TMAO reductase YedYZ molybdopterin-dependent catalytic subunit